MNKNQFIFVIDTFNQTFKFNFYQTVKLDYLETKKINSFK